MRSDPAPNSTVKASPGAVRIRFKIAGTEGLDPTLSTISVCDASGGRVDDARGGVDPHDPKRRSLLAKLRPLVPGTYTVTWKAVSSEYGDVATGTFQFTMASHIAARGRRHRVTTPALFLLCVLLWWACAEQRAAAHAVLERSNPPTNTALENPPGRVDLWFSEEIDKAFSSARLLDSRGQTIAGPGSVSSGSRQITLPLPSLPQGLYTVTWRVLSVVDGHATSGVVLFGVGTAVANARAPGAEPRIDPGLVVLRWVGFLAAFLLAGVEFFRIAALNPGLHKLPHQNRVALMSAAVPALREVTVSAGVVFLAVLVAEVARLTMHLADASFLEVVRSGALWRLLWGTNPGWSALVRAGAAALLLLPPTQQGRMFRAAGLLWGILAGTLFAALGGPAAIASHLPVLFLTFFVYGLMSIGFVVLWPYLSDSRPVSLAWVPPAVAAVLLAGFTVSAHAWGSGPIAVAVDWLHLVALATWIGGLASLLVITRAVGVGDRPPLLRAVVPRFSSVAAIALAVVIGTGLYSALLHMPSLYAFRTTDYGRTLLIKLALVVPLVALGAVNRFVIRPRLEGKETTGRPGLQGRLQGFVSGEVGLAAAIVLVVAVLTALPPARVTGPAGAMATVRALRLAATSGDVAVTLTIEPPLPGPISIGATATGPAGRPLGESRVLTRVMKLDEDLTPTTIVLTPRGEGHYEAVTGELALAGFWEIEVVVRRAGRPDTAVRFPIRLGTPPLRPVDPAAGRMLTETRQAIRSLRTWRQSEQITDGVGGGSLVQWELARPDRLRYRASGGEGIVIGSEQFQRSTPGSRWTRTVLPQPLRVAGVETYLEGAERSARLGRSGPCDEESCRVSLWDSSGGVSYAAWIGQSSKLVHRLLMVAPSHHMTLECTDFNMPLRIEAPR